MAKLANMSRADFLKTCSKLIGLKTITRFSIIGSFTAVVGKILADECNSPVGMTDRCDAFAPDNCLGGLPENDTCNLRDPDSCPGGGNEADQCDDNDADYCPGEV